MTFQLTYEEFDKVRDIVRILVEAHDRGILSTEQEREIIRLALEIEPLTR